MELWPVCNLPLMQNSPRDTVAADVWSLGFNKIEVIETVKPSVLTRQDNFAGVLESGI